jgi:hypothetical protein
MSAIPAASVKVSTLVDGTLRIVCDIEPGDAQAAFRLFATPGTPMALAALKTASSKPEKEERPFRGELCRWAAMRCQEPEFAAFLESTYPALWAEHFLGDGKPADEAAAEVVRNLCGVASRVELDTNEAAAALLHSSVRKPYSVWLKANPK